MSAAKHTPGPWAAQRTPASAFFDWTVTAPSGAGRVMQIGVDTDNTEADARLIAAAPELLAALKRALDAGIGGDGSRPSPSEQVRAAIAKATGSAA